MPCQAKLIGLFTAVTAVPQSYVLAVRPQGKGSVAGSDVPLKENFHPGRQEKSL